MDDMKANLDIIGQSFTKSFTKFEKKGFTNSQKTVIFQEI